MMWNKFCIIRSFDVVTTFSKHLESRSDASCYKKIAEILQRERLKVKASSNDKKWHF